MFGVGGTSAWSLLTFNPVHFTQRPFTPDSKKHLEQHELWKISKWGWPAMGGQTFCYACKALSDTFTTSPSKSTCLFHHKAVTTAGSWARNPWLPLHVHLPVYWNQSFTPNLLARETFDTITKCFRCEKNFITTVFLDTTTFRPRQSLR